MFLTEVSFCNTGQAAHCLVIANAESRFKSLLVIQRRARWLQLAIAAAGINSDYRTWTVVKLVRTGVTCWRLDVERGCLAVVLCVVSYSSMKVAYTQLRLSRAPVHGITDVCVSKPALGNRPWLWL